MKLRQYIVIFSNRFVQERCFLVVSGLELVDDSPVIAWSLVQLMINLTRGNLIMTPLSYHSSNLSLITLGAMRLLVLISEKKNNSRKLYPTFPGWPYCACLYGKFSSRRGGIWQNQVRSYQGRLVHILYEHILLKKFVKEVEVSLR